MMGVGRGSGYNSNGRSGVSPHSSSSSYDPTPTPKKLPNPDPFNFRVLMERKIGPYLVGMVIYPDATNFEGVKVLLMKDMETFKGLRQLDPHFFEGGNLIARFLPSEEGWDMAIKVASRIWSDEKSEAK